MRGWVHVIRAFQLALDGSAVACVELGAMLAAGVVFEEAPRHEPYGSVAVWRDPFGNRWDLIGPSRAG